MADQLNFDAETNRFINKLNFSAKDPRDVDHSDLVESNEMENHVLAEDFKQNSIDIDKVNRQAEYL